MSGLKTIKKMDMDKKEKVCLDEIFAYYANETGVEIEEYKRLYIQTDNLGTPRLSADGNPQMSKLAVSFMTAAYMNPLTYGRYYCKFWRTAIADIRRFWDDLLVDTLVKAKYPVRGTTYIHDIRVPFVDIEWDETRGIPKENNGILEMFRYVKDGYPYMKRIGRVFQSQVTLLKEEFTDYESIQPIITYLSENLTHEWVAERMAETSLRLVINDDFESIYDRCEDKDFHSCMAGQGQWSFYANQDCCEAASLQDDDGEIFARCIIFTKVKSFKTGKIIRYAERIYGDTDNHRHLLLSLLLKEGNIDAYKNIGASCHDKTQISWVDTSLGDASEDTFSTHFNLKRKDILSYQDTFAFYLIDKGIAYNRNDGLGYDYCCLDTTDSNFDGSCEVCACCGRDIDIDEGEYIEYNGEYYCSNCYRYDEIRGDYIPKDVSVSYMGSDGTSYTHEDEIGESIFWVESRECYCAKDILVQDYRTGEYLLRDEAIEVMVGVLSSGWVDCYNPDIVFNQLDDKYYFKDDIVECDNCQFAFCEGSGIEFKGEE